MRCLILSLLLLSPFVLIAQENCKVLVPEISDNYEGRCRNGLAHGKGKAIGQNIYIGNFRRGLPHGIGTYIWENGATYKGRWKNGKRQGEGTFSMRIPETDRDSILSGFWRDDEFIGKVKKPAYQIVERRNVDRFTISRIGSENRIVFQFYRGTSINRTIQNLYVYGNTGELANFGGYVGYDNINFPFKARVTYRTSNKTGMVQYDVTLEFEINEPGNWVVKLYN